MQEYNKFLIAAAGGVVAILNAVGLNINFASIEGMLALIVPAATAVLVALMPNVGDSFDRAASYVDEAKGLLGKLQDALDKVPSPTQPE